MKLRLGVVDLPYAEHEGVTTADVAGWLETRYGVMQRFFDFNAPQIANDMAESIAKTMENIMAGAPATMDPFASAMQDIQQLWRPYIQFEQIVSTGAPGVPTFAALEGVNHRLKLKKGPRRPSFRDTGLYESSFISWVESEDEALTDA